MKRTSLLLALLLMLNIALFSQTIYWTEEFNSNQGWTLDQNWSFSGGKIRFYWTPSITNFDLSATSPEIQLHENTVDLIVKQHLDAFNSSNPPETAEIYLISGITEVLLWDHTLNMGDWGLSTGSDIYFDISEFAGQTVRFKFRTFGPTTYNWNWWDVFSIQLTAMFQNDLAALSINGPKILDPDETGTWNVQVKNYGSQAQSGFSVSMFSLKFNDFIGTVDVLESIQPQQSLTVDFSWTPPIAHNTALYAVVDLFGDEFEDNNISKSHFVRIVPDIPFTVLVWDNDNGIQTITDPEVGDLIEPSLSLTRALDNTGINYQLVSSLPPFLNNYDIIFATMGCYCLS
jgi:hypothetical protein